MRRAESCPSRIGPISGGVKQMGARSAGNPHAACDVEGTGNVARSSGLPARQPSTLLMSGDGKRGVGHRPQATAPILDSTKAPKPSFRMQKRIGCDEWIPDLPTG